MDFTIHYSQEKKPNIKLVITDDDRKEYSVGYYHVHPNHHEHWAYVLEELLNSTPYQETPGEDYNEHN